MISFCFHRAGVGCIPTSLSDCLGGLSGMNLVELIYIYVSIREYVFDNKIQNDEVPFQQYTFFLFSGSGMFYQLLLPTGSR